jgi:uncharacterized membrane protein YqjE
MEEELCNQEICKMINLAFFDIFGIIIFIILLFIGIKFSKYKIKHIKTGGYILIIIGIIGLIVDLYNVISNYLI